MIHTETRSPYRLHINKNVLQMLLIEDKKPDDALMFFTEQVENLLNVEPNLPAGKGRSKSKGNIQTSDAWVVRGFYPDSRVMFKLTMTRVKGNPQLANSIIGDMDADFFVRVSLVKSQLLGVSCHDGAELRKSLLEHKAEQALLGASTPRPKVITLNFRRPRCMTPKGTKLLLPKRSRSEVKT